MTSPEELHFYLQAGPHVDSDHPAVQALALQTTRDIGSVRERAVALYYAVRDGFRYDPYAIQAVDRCFTASVVVETGSGFCISKAALLAATARVAGIPARVGFADVKNHLTSPRLRELMDSDEFVYHGYSELWIDGRWVKATPAFNRTLCDKANVRPLEFDGQTDSLFHPLDQSGRKHMEYLRDHGCRPDIPAAEILTAWKKFYPKMATWGQHKTGSNFEQEVVREVTAE